MQLLLSIKLQTYNLHQLITLKSWSLNLLEPPGLVQACNGNALPLFSIKRCISFTNTNLLVLLREMISVLWESNESVT